MFVGDYNCREEANCLHQILQDVKLGWGRHDTWVWTLETSKIFTVKSCYRSLVNNDLPDGVNRSC